MGGFYPTWCLIQPYLAFCLIRGVECEDTVQACSIQTTFLCYPCSNARLLPQSCALHVLASVAWILPGTRLLEHTTSNACASLAHFLHFFPPRVCETSSHFWFCRLLVHAEIGREVRLVARVHGKWSLMVHAFVLVVAHLHVLFAMILQHWVERVGLYVWPVPTCVSV